jgi:hypothetical protein
MLLDKPLEWHPLLVRQLPGDDVLCDDGVQLLIRAPAAKSQPSATGSSVRLLNSAYLATV